MIEYTKWKFKGIGPDFQTLKGREEKDQTRMKIIFGLDHDHPIEYLDMPVMTATGPDLTTFEGLEKYKAEQKQEQDENPGPDTNHNDDSNGNSDADQSSTLPKRSKRSKN